MVRNFLLVLAAATLTGGPVLAQGMTQQQLQQMQGAPPVSEPLRPPQPQQHQMKPTPQMPQAPLRPAGDNGPMLQRIGASLQQIMQQLQSYGAQQKSNPQALALTQVMLLEADYMRGVAATVYQQNRAKASVAPADKLKMQSMKQSADSVVPQIAQQKKAVDQALKDQQAKLEDAAKKLEQAEKSKQSKDQGGQLVNFHIALLQIRAQLDKIMLAEMAD